MVPVFFTSVHRLKLGSCCSSAQLERDVAALKKKVRDLEAQLKDARADLSRERDNKRDHDNQINVWSLFVNSEIMHSARSILYHYRH